MLGIISDAMSGRLSPLEALIVAVAFLLAIMLAITAHEYAHGFVAYKCGDMTAKYSGRLSLNPAKHFDPIGFLMLMFVGFGWAKPVPINPNNFTKNYKKSMIGVCIAGVVTNIVLAFLIYPAYLGTRKIGVSSDAAYYGALFLVQFCFYFYSINLSLAVFNLLPIYPLDGFNLLDTVAKPYNKAVEFLRRYGTIILLVVLLSSGIPIFGGYSLLGLLNKWIGTPITMFWGWIFSFIG